MYRVGPKFERRTGSHGTENGVSMGKTLTESQLHPWVYGSYHSSTESVSSRIHEGLKEGGRAEQITEVSFRRRFRPRR